MTELEIVLLCAFVFMYWMYRRANHMMKYYQCAIVAIGLNEATVSVDESDKTFTIKVNKVGLEQRISRS